MLGKLPPDLLSRSVLNFTGSQRGDLIIGGGLGEDAALIDFFNKKNKKFLVAASDPITGAAENAGRLLVHVNANDIACKGGVPSWLIVTLIIPENYGVNFIENIMREIHETCLKMGIAIAGGHTELTDKYQYPVLCGTMLGHAEKIFSAKNIKPGDKIIVTGHAGLEGISILAHDRPDLLNFFDNAELDIIKSWSDDISVVPAAEILKNFAVYMHDPTEGGLNGGILETARACNLNIKIDNKKIPVSPLTLKAAEKLNFNYLNLISSGMLIAAVPENKAQNAAKALLENNIKSEIIGEFLDKENKNHEEHEKAENYLNNIDAHEELWEIIAKIKL